MAIGRYCSTWCYSNYIYGYTGHFYKRYAASPAGRTRIADAFDSGRSPTTTAARRTIAIGDDRRLVRDVVRLGRRWRWRRLLYRPHRLPKLSERTTKTIKYAGYCGIGGDLAEASWLGRQRIRPLDYEKGRESVASIAPAHHYELCGNRSSYLEASPDYVHDPVIACITAYYHPKCLPCPRIATPCLCCPQPEGELSDGFTSGDNLLQQQLNTRAALFVPLQAALTTLVVMRAHGGARIAAGVTPGSSQPTKSPKWFLTSTPLAGVTSSASSLRLRSSTATGFGVAAIIIISATGPMLAWSLFHRIRDVTSYFVGTSLTVSIGSSIRSDVSILYDIQLYFRCMWVYSQKKINWAVSGFLSGSPLLIILNKLSFISSQL